MQFRTPVELPKQAFQINHRHQLCVMGSCFSEHIGGRLTDAKFRCTLNPFGILYNPRSIAVALRQIMQGKVYAPSDLVEDKELFHSMMHHGSFSGGEQQLVLDGINSSISEAHEQLPRLNHLLITFGTAWIYTLKSSGEVVGNCHKMPARLFERTRLSVEDVVTDYTALINELLLLNPDCKIIFTVSPIRHIKETLHGNQISKSTLLLAIETLCQSYPEAVFYFPSYEILLDELRDYRFYADDMLHPSPVAVEYIWSRFSDFYFSAETKEIIKSCQKIKKDIAHRPYHTHSEAYMLFLNQIVLKIDELLRKYPKLDFRKEKQQCHTLLNQLQKR